MEIETSDLVGQLIIASVSSRMANRAEMGVVSSHKRLNFLYVYGSLFYNVEHFMLIMICDMTAYLLTA